MIFEQSMHAMVVQHSAASSSQRATRGGEAVSSSVGRVHLASELSRLLVVVRRDDDVEFVQRLGDVARGQAKGQQGDVIQQRVRQPSHRQTRALRQKERQAVVDIDQLCGRTSCLEAEPSAVWLCARCARTAQLHDCSVGWYCSASLDSYSCERQRRVLTGQLTGAAQVCTLLGSACCCCCCCCSALTDTLCFACATSSVS